MVQNEYITADGMDDAIIGTAVNSNGIRVLVYYVPHCIELLIESGLTEEEARQVFEEELRSTHFGMRSPIWVDDEL